MKRIIIACGLLCVAITAGFGAGNAGTIVVNMTDFRNSTGQACVSLFNQPGGFPDKVDKAFKKAFTHIDDNTASVVFRNIPYGEYAVCMIHDENKNFKVETNRIGIPKEGYGASNDARAFFGPPKYSAARFIFNKQMMIINIKVRYF